MAEGKRVGSGPQIVGSTDMGQLMLDAHNRWLRPVEICEILKNHRLFPIQSEPPNRPPGGSFFLFDRRVLRYFRKDGHNWRKKKDGKTVKEAHEKLKDGSIDVLHCYYAHGEDDESLQRRSYWMLEEDLTHLVFVHYRNVKGSKASTSHAKDVQPALCNTQDGSPFSLNSMPVYNQMQCMDSSESPPSGQSSEYEDAETDNYQASPGYNSFLEVPRDNLKHVADTSHLEPYIPVMLPPIPGDFQGYKDAASDFIALAQEDVTFYPEMGMSTCNMASTSADLTWATIPRHPSVDFQTVSCVPPMFASANNANDRRDVFFNDFSTDELIFRNVPIDVPSGAEGQLTRSGNCAFSNFESDMDALQNTSLGIGKSKKTYIAKQLSMEFPNMEGDAGLKKLDSFSRWMSRELEEVDGLQSNSGICWDEVENDSAVEESCMSNQSPIEPYVLSPSLAQDQLFSIIDFTPCWGYVGLQTKVLVTGTFLTSKNDIETYQWSCMFGEVEVPAEVIADGTLQCYAPQHRAGQVPFYVTCSNRLACSEVREFDYVMDPSQNMENSESYRGSTSETLLYSRFEKMISLDRVLSDLTPNRFCEQASKCKKICTLLRDVDGNYKNLDGSKDQKLLKEKLCSWLLHKINEDEKGLGVLDAAGQSIIHLAAALDYEWAMEPIVTAGVGINFRDVSGWTALHWAAYYGREQTVVVLMYLGAAPGVLTDPTVEFPSGRTPADLASSKGHKGIAGYLAELSLTSHLSTLTFKEPVQINAANCTEATDGNTNWNSVHFLEGEMNNDSSLKDSLSAVRTATQAAARIHMAFRMQSFHRKKMIEYEDDVPELSDEHVLSLVAVKSNKSSRNADTLHAAATKIQNKYRGWKGRQEYLIIRKRIINIQAHVRGYQVRKRKKLFWTIGIVQKALMWRRRAQGSYHVQSETLVDGPSSSSPPTNGKEQDLLKEGRKQSEVRLEKALARVKSMVQYPEARDQYRRLRTGVEEFKSQATLESILTDPPDSIDMDMLDEIEELLGDDAEMPLG